MNDLIKIKKIDDLEISTSANLINKTTYFLTSTSKSLYFKLNEEEYIFFSKLIPLLNGQYNHLEIEKIMSMNNFSKELTNKALTFFEKKNLLLNNKQTDTKNKIEIDMVSKKFFEITFKNLNNFGINLIKNIILILALLSILGTLMLVLYQQRIYNIFLESISGTHIFFKDLSFLSDVTILIFIITISTILHEIGHIMLAYYNKVNPKSLTLTFKYGLLPIFYVKYENFYVATAKKKLSILLGGIWINFIIIYISMFLLLFIDNWIISATMIVNMGLILSCLNPLGSSDGYFIITILFELEGFRWQMLKKTSNLLNKKITIKEYFNKKNIKYSFYFLVSYGLSFFSIYNLAKICLSFFYFNISTVHLSFLVIFIMGLIFTHNLFLFYTRLKTM